MDIKIELFGGPGDGLILEVPDYSRVWTIPTPLMTPAQFLALENGGPYTGPDVPVQEHVYVRTATHGVRTHARIFSYSGPRRAG